MRKGDCDYDDEIWEKRENCIKILSYKIVYKDCTREEKVIGYYSNQSLLEEHAAWFEEYTMKNIDFLTLEMSESVIPLDTIRRMPSNPKNFDPNKIDHAMRVAQNKMRQKKIDDDKAEIEFFINSYKREREELKVDSLTEEEKAKKIEKLSEKKKNIVSMINLNEEMNELHGSILRSDYGILRDVQ
jgi:hypothetical protein